MATPAQNTNSKKLAGQVLQGFRFPTGTDGGVLPLFSGGRPNRPTTATTRATDGEVRQEVMTKQTHLVPKEEERAESVFSPSDSVHQHPLHRSQSAAQAAHVRISPAVQEPEPPQQAPLFPCDASGAVLPLFHPSTSTPTSPWFRFETVITSSDNPLDSFPCDDAPAMTGSGAPVPVAVVEDEDEEGEEDEDNSVERVIEWIDEMLTGCRVVSEGVAEREKKKERRASGRNGGGAQEVLEWLEGLKFEDL
ncbi:hypothetical protein L873DRAFT_1790156 [Choiromyces venosus 120613-1]|uniref:Uncharacterized protein n=1 Tax=Choiromyces venosus 120613-1 TaxID=1336337 RepID=A0A3N4JKL5_9PEZI|nr:hypothetical protein L873DRAFT_1790156 [Choiromyces venosus 120613-1]